MLVPSCVRSSWYICAHVAQTVIMQFVKLHVTTIKMHTMMDIYTAHHLHDALHVLETHAVDRDGYTRLYKAIQAFPKARAPRIQYKPYQPATQHQYTTPGQGIPRFSTWRGDRQPMASQGLILQENWGPSSACCDCFLPLANRPVACWLLRLDCLMCSTKARRCLRASVSPPFSPAARADAGLLGCRAASEGLKPSCCMLGMAPVSMLQGMGSMV